MKAYIAASSAISPQPTFMDDAYLQELVQPGPEYLSAIEPSYRDYIDPRLSRRMSRVIKMGVASAISCLRKAGIEQPEAIIVGTGLGCLQDTEKFLADLVENQEGLLSPTSFIQSTHNTIAGQIALLLSCPNYNFTYVQRGHSFENALEDGLLQLQEGQKQLLIGGVDEITDTVFNILRKTDCIDTAAGRYPELTSSAERPALGEGAAFFLLSAEKTPESLACIEGVHTFYKPASQQAVEEHVQQFMAELGISSGEVDAVMMGYTGHEKQDVGYTALQQKLFSAKPVLRFKHICGEYFTASAFGHHLTAKTLESGQAYPHSLIQGQIGEPLRNILLYNHYKGDYHTLTYLSACRPL